MPDIPSAVLSDRFEEALRGRRVLSAVFLTYQFEPAFFEQQIVPILFDVTVSHVPGVRLVQLEDTLRSVPGDIAVYYDANGLMASDAGSAKLDIRRIPVRHSTGIFHAKNVFALVESQSDADGGNEEAPAQRALVIGSMSANLTEAGWWRNVEVAHFEEVAAGDRTMLREDLIAFLSEVRRRAGAAADAGHTALATIVSFLRTETEQRTNKSTDGVLHPHFYRGAQAIDAFVAQVIGQRVRGCCIEVISPYFDDGTESEPLQRLIELVGPPQVRVLLPRAADGAALCPEAMHKWLTETAGGEWGRLTGDLIRFGQGDQAAERFVHAKVYRFFSARPRREFILVGSANLTQAGFQHGGNLESGFLLELVGPGKPDFWLQPDKHAPGEFRLESEDVGSSTSGGSRLSVQFRWTERQARVYWDDRTTSPQLGLTMRGVSIGTLQPLAPREWTSLPDAFGERIGSALSETSFLTVEGDRAESVHILVQEEGMEDKPSLLLQLSVPEILRYWALLSAEQRAAFIAQRQLLQAAAGGTDDAYALPSRATPDAADGIFERFAGIYHAFGCLERAVRNALDRQANKEAVFRLFGEKYDSLPTLLARLVDAAEKGDPVERYVTYLSARQMCEVLRRDYPAFWDEHRGRAQSLQTRLERLKAIRDELAGPEAGDMSAFLTWFERWFLQRATPTEARDA